MIKKTAFAVIAIIAVFLFNFILPRMMPGNPMMFVMGGVKLEPETREMLIRRFGLDKSVWEQFIAYTQRSLQGDLGFSFLYYPRTVTSLIMKRLPWTLALLVPSLFLAAGVGIIVGVFSAWKRGSKFDVFMTNIGLFIWSLPFFWLALLFLLVFGYYYPIFPLRGSISIGMNYPNWFAFFKDWLWHSTLPILSLTIWNYAGYALMMRNTMVDILDEEYITTATVKGLSERTIMFKHAARNAMLPVVTQITLSLGFTLGGSIFTETVFSYPGVGLLAYDAVMSRDYPLTQGVMLISAIAVILANLFADVIYAKLDPRVRF
jgi:peptide/nickel transport system permease protein